MHTIKIILCGKNNIDIFLFITYCGSVRNREVKDSSKVKQLMIKPKRETLIQDKERCVFSLKKEVMVNEKPYRSDTDD